MSETNGQSYGERMREHLKAMVTPLEAEYAELGKHEAELMAQLEEVRQARRDAIVVLRRIDPDKYSEGKPGRKTEGSGKSNAKGPGGRPDRAWPHAEQDSAIVREWIEAHRAELPPDFTAQRVYTGMKGNGSPLGKDKVRHSVELLHDRGWLTLIRFGSGGGKFFQPTSEVVSNP